MTQISSLLHDIEAYNNDNRLRGAAYTSHKTYMTQGHGDYLGKLERALAAKHTANQTHINALDTYLSTHSWFHSGQIHNEIDCWTIQINLLNVLMIASPIIGLFMRNTRDNLINLRNNRRQKLQQIENYINATHSIYDEPNRLVAEVDRSLVRIEFADRCMTTGAVTLPTMVRVDEIIKKQRIFREVMPNSEYTWEQIKAMSPEERARLFESDMRLMAAFAVTEGLASAHNVDSQIFFEFHDVFWWNDYGRTVDGKMILTEIDGRMNMFLHRPDVNGVSVPFGFFNPDPFQTIFDNGWDGTVFSFYHFRSTDIPESLRDRTDEMKEIATHYALRSNSENAGKAILNYLGYYESLEMGNPKTSFFSSELDVIAGRWSGTSGRKNFYNEIEAHADLLLDNDLRANLSRAAMELRGRGEEAYFNAVAIADMAANDNSIDKILMDILWYFRNTLR
jgi:hypothetical protein